MTTEARFQSREQHYAAQADEAWRRFIRDPVIEPGAHGRADVANGPMSKWLRFNRAEDLVWVTDPEGVPRALTRNQAAVYGFVRGVSGKSVRVSMREVALRLGVNASTVHRAAVKLSALGFIAYQSNRGRLGGTMFVLRFAKDGLDWAREEAKAKIRKWRLAAEARISRLRGNVASYFPGRERELYEHRYSPSISNSNRTQHFREWTVEDFREAGLM